ncbi:MAG: S-methyl-5-thioribose-1-phosphate isomerase [Calditrichaeota bacterium]|nr:MAG: S-methyl-5-thioribose-1-phosphate isomerase [Calditrichota bacterium]
MIKAVEWKESYLQLIDQTLIPSATVYKKITTIEETFEAIRNLRVRGAPAIGITAAYGLYLGMRESKASTREEFLAELSRHIEYLAEARPTAVNLFWAMDEIKERLHRSQTRDVNALKKELLTIALEIHEDDRQRCEEMANYGQEVIPEGARIITHCNTGALATGGIGTAFGVIYRAHQLGKQVSVFADETRPVLQGARLTVFELMEAGIPTTLICDNMAAALMQQRKVDLAIVGADRIAMDGSVANKIGTYNLAVLAKYHGIPFFVAAPLSTIDPEIHSGKDIPIETRPEDEIRKVFNQCLITVPSVPCWNPAFDVTPPELVSGIITEKGVLKPPYTKSIQEVLNNSLINS